MQFSDTTNKNGVIQRVEFTLELPDGAISGDSTLLKYVTALANDTYQEIGSAIWLASRNWMDRLLLKLVVRE